MTRLGLLICLGVFIASCGPGAVREDRKRDPFNGQENFINGIASPSDGFRHDDDD